MAYNGEDMEGVDEGIDELMGNDDVGAVRSRALIARKSPLISRIP